MDLNAEKVPTAVVTPKVDMESNVPSLHKPEPDFLHWPETGDLQIQGP